MADKYAHLDVSERVNAAVELLQKHSSLSARKAAKICNVHYISVIRRSNGIPKPYNKESERGQVLSAAEESTLIK
jgi:hypothetical protein